MINPEDFVPININVLIEGMRVDYSIYYKINGSYILLCKDIELTKDLLTKLRKTQGVQGCVYVQKKFQKALLKESACVRNVKKDPEDEVGYTGIRDEVKDLLDIISENNVLPAESITVISDSLTDRVQTANSSMLIQCINSVRKVDEYLYTHSVNVAILNGLMGKWARLDDKSIAELVKTGLLHDIGKLQIPDNILNKPSGLSEAEFEIMKRHSTYSYEMLKNAGEVSNNILLGVKHHHERIDGTGYPDGMTLEEIPEFARITAVSDVYDAMVSERVYKSANSPFKILAELEVGRFSTLDTRYVNLFLQHVPDELTRKYCILSNGEKARVVYTNPNDFIYPIVELEGRIIATNKDLYCVSMCFDEE